MLQMSETADCISSVRMASGRSRGIILLWQMVRIGEVGAKEAREHPDKNIITRAVGAGEEVEADFFEVELKKDDHILICTDGLTNMVEDEEICSIILRDASIEERAGLLL